MTSYLFRPPERVSVKILESEKRFAVNRVFCVGQNYAVHAIEMGFQPNRDQPFYFTKSPSSVVASGSTIPYPFSTDNFHHEMELVVAIGAGGYEILPDTALSHVFGYACGLDMTRRDLQTSLRAKGHPWCISKDVENGAVISSIQPAKICGHPTKARIWLSVNGQIKQDSNIDRLIWSVPEIVSDLSKFYHLSPGDLIYSGTPSGVGAVYPGDIVEGEIEYIGSISLNIAPPAPSADINAKKLQGL